MKVSEMVKHLAFFPNFSASGREVARVPLVLVRLVVCFQHGLLLFLGLWLLQKTGSIGDSPAPSGSQFSMFPRFHPIHTPQYLELHWRLAFLRPSPRPLLREACPAMVTPLKYSLMQNI